ncbi:hypothetical protein MKEN_00613700 [Mycena kentingensis (nom. inval.)]|nr:hypothetical protein MKEN_00613700 [Mycena kentingensis (nom. inval.)]
MQTRRQARQQAEAEQAAAALLAATTVPASTNANAREPSPFSSTLSTLTPSSTFVSVSLADRERDREAPPLLPEQSQSQSGGAAAAERPAALIARAFGVPHLPTPSNALAWTTPSNTVYYPPEVFETPQKGKAAAPAPTGHRHTPPTESEIRTAEWARDVELAKDGRMRLSSTGTLLVPGPDVDDVEPLEPGKGLGIGLGSAFTSPQQVRATAQSSRALRRATPRDPGPARQT